MICEVEYSQSNKYCPNCGTKNEDFIEDNSKIEDLKKEIKNNDYFQSKADNELMRTRSTVSPINFKSKDFADIFNEDFGGYTGSFSGTGGTSGGSSGTTRTDDDYSRTERSKSKPFVICPNCRRENDLTNIYCESCRFSLKKYKICPSCGYITKDGDNFCGDCGTKLKAIKSCPKCKAPVEINAKFCGECGNKFD